MKEQSRVVRHRVHPPASAGLLLVTGSCALAITQPVLDLFGRNPEFFVAGGYTKSQIVLFGALVSIVPSAVLSLVYLACRALGPRTGHVVLSTILGLLGGAFGSILVRGIGVDSASITVAASVVGALAVVFGSRRRPVALLIRYLSGAQVLFLFSFLVFGPTGDLLWTSADDDAIGEVEVPVPPGPVVVVVFDSLPLASIIRSDGTVNDERFPGFGRLAASSTWYRNASTLEEFTELAVPAIATGVDVDRRTTPTSDEFPRNLFSLLGRSMPVVRHEPVTDLCPPDVCEDRSRHPLSAALRDATIVFGHRMLPTRFAGWLPPIDDGWGDFGGVAAAEPASVPEGGAGSGVASDHAFAKFFALDATERSAFNQNRRLVEVGLTIDGTPKLHFAHVVTPHAPWLTTQTGHRMLTPVPGLVEDPADGGYEWSVRTRFQRHSMQVGAADLALTQVFDQLDRVGAWRDATLVVVADHGTSTLPPDFGRPSTETNREEIFRVPLFIKAPGQEVGAVVDDVAFTIDVVPTLIDLLGIETDWDMDGHSLVDGTRPSVAPEIDSSTAPLLDLARRHEEHFPRGWSWEDLAAVGEHADLVGTSIDDLEIGEPSDLGWELQNEDAFRSLPTADGAMPQLVRGRIQSAEDARPPPLVVVVNGVVAGVTGTYGVNDDGWSFSSMLGPFLVDGENTVAAYEVTEGPVGPVLHRVA